MIKRLFKLFILYLLPLLLITLGLITWVVGTESGLRTVVAQAQKWAPGTLKIDTLEGRLLDKLSFTGLSYQLDDLAVQVNSFQLEWEAGALWDWQLHVEKLHINGVEANLPKSAEKEAEEPKESAPLELPDLELPVQIALDDVQIRQVTIRSPGAEPFVIDSLDLRSTTTDVFTLQHLQIDSPLFKAKIAGNVGLTAPHTVQLNLDWSANLPDFTVAGQGELSGNTQKLILVHTVSQPLAVELNSVVEDVLTQPRFNVDLKWQEVYWPFFAKEGKSPLKNNGYLVHSEQGHITLTGTPEDYQLDFKTKVSGQQIPTGHWTIAAQGNQQALTLTKLRAELLKGAVEATGHVSWQPKLVAQINLDVDKITVKDFWKDWPDRLRVSSQLAAKLDGDHYQIDQLDVTLPKTAAKISVKGEGWLAGDKTSFENVTLAWQGLQWPLVGKKPIATSKTGRVNVSGTPQNYRVDLDTQLAGAQVPRSHLTLAGQGNLQQFTLDSLRTKTLKGAVNATGKVSWQPKLAGQFKLDVNKITLKELWKDWPNKLRVKSQLVAKLEGDHFQISQLEVTLPKTAAKISFKGEGVLAGENTRFKDVRLAWQGLQWPLVGRKPLVTSKKGRVDLSGTPQNYRVDLDTQLAGAQVPRSHLTLAGQGNLQQFTLDSLRTKTLKGAVNATGKVSWQPKLAGQFKLDVKKITIKELWKDWPNKLRVNSQLVAKLDGDHFQISQLKVTLPKTAAKISFKGEGVLAGENTRFKDVRLTWQGLQWPLVGRKPLVTSKKGRVDLSGTPQNYRVNLKTQLAGAQVPYSRLTLAGQGNLQQFKLKSLRTKTLRGAINGTGKISWQPKLVGQLNLDVDKITVKQFWQDWPDKLRINSQLIAKLDGDNFKLKTLKVNIPQTGAKISLQADGSLAGKAPSFNAKLAWKGVQWPLVGSPSLVSSKKGNLRAEGTPDAYKLRLYADIQGQDIPAGRWDANGRGDSRHFKLKSLQGKILQGALDLSGQVYWQPNVSWNLALKGNNLNPGSQWAEWPGNIALDIRSQGKLKKNGALDTQVQVKHVRGNLRDNPLKLKTEVAVILPPNTSTGATPRILINAFKFNSGNTRLTANGQLGPNSNLSWAINAPNLATLLPEGKGSLTGNGRLTGPLNLPHITATLKGNALGFQDNSLKTLKVDVDVNLRTQEDLHLDVVATDLSAGTTQIKRVKLGVNGSGASHTLVASVTMPKDRFSLQVQGGLKQSQSRWQGQLQQLTAATAQAGYWQLQAPASLMLSATEAQLARSCLQNTRTIKFCTQLNWRKTADSMVHATLTNLPLNLVQAFLPEGSEISGTVNGKVAATLHPDGALNSKVAINLSPGVLKTYVSEEEVKKFPLHGGALNLQINRRGLTADLNLQLLKQSGLRGAFNLPRFTHLPPRGEQPMQGKLKATFADLSILPVFVPQTENTKGRVTLDVTLGGTLTKPDIQGQLLVQNAEVDVPDVGLEIRKLNVDVHNEGRETVKMQVSMNSGKSDSGEAGQLNLNGTANFRSGTDWKADLNIAGKNFEVVNITEAWALISPDIDIKIISPKKIDVKSVPGRVDVTGEVTIPEVAVTPPKAATGEAIAVSKDVVIVNPKNPVPEKEKVSDKWAISSKVKIILGDKVSFEGAGFKSRFGGSLVASNQPGKVTVGNGELYILEGSYKAYGQRLTIDEGRVFFSGGPIENPGLDIPAYRRIKRRGNDDIIAGVHIQGTAQEPKLVLYSKPQFDQTNTLSYILLGKPAAQATQGEGNFLLAAAASLPLKEGHTVAQKVGEELGLDEAGISTEEGVEKAALVLGKYLTPGLYVSYGIGLFDGSNVLRMRYDLTKRLTLETETGTQSGVDLRYTLER